jgi:2-polyprenyl-3-methyl-5-hydroxy-6-metoxy-1,4-benzoquinol methylase
MPLHADTKNDLEIVSKTFEEYFKINLPKYEQFGKFFKSEEIYIKYFKKVIYFCKSVIEPLEYYGMQKTDTIIDLASGDGQMSLALFLKDYKNVTLYDLDNKRLNQGSNIIEFFLKIKPKIVCGSALNFDGEYDVIISYQTIEHLSDTGNYSIANKRCQKVFLEKINKQIKKMVYINAPNFLFPIDGHDTGKWFFHFLPMKIRKILIDKKFIKCSWSGIAEPVSTLYLNRFLKSFSLCSSYYAFPSMAEYLLNRPPFDYMGNKIVAQSTLSFSKRILKKIEKLIGKKIQNVLPVLSLVYNKRF